jgi:NAD+ synthase
VTAKRKHYVAPVEERAAGERAYMEAGGRRTLINSLSGGVDSATSAVISQQAAPGRAFALMLPCSEEPERLVDAADARRVAETLGMPHVVINLLDLWRQAVGLYSEAAREMSARSGVPLDEAKLRWAVNNLKPTLRMMTAGFFADAFDGLMVGTDNAIENFLGYFSIRGDGVADRQPIRDCTKAEVRALARSGGIPEAIVSRTPTAGLWPGQTDEGELGFTYNEADAFFTWLLDLHLEQPVMDQTMTVTAEAVEVILGRPDLPVDRESARRIIAQNRRTAFKRKADDLEMVLRKRRLL